MPLTTSVWINFVMGMSFHDRTIACECLEVIDDTADVPPPFVMQTKKKSAEDRTSVTPVSMAGLD